ncbi:phage tail tape measure protein [Pseudomonas sp. UBA6562]|uniref:phage tail tape measure protein n=1 Tax=Pseudomonas sp. UBA6562 TaxID=1947332 RepID=UPI0025D3EA19|nr:phage tail tape measure protein [Pseudomonas sp. UBA6562]
MSSKLALAVVIGGAVSSSVGAAFKNVEGRIDKLEKQGNKAKALKGMIGETMRLRDEWRKAHESGAANASKLLNRLEANNNALRKQGVEVGRLASEYARLGQVARASDLQMKGHQQVEQGRASLKSSLGQAVVATGLVTVPAKISADYQAIIRDIAIKADIVNKPEEAQLNRTVIDTASNTGMSRNDVADLVNQLVGAGMELDKALSYAPVAAKFAIGQGASGVDTASMIQALEQNAKITDPKVMQQALEAIAYQGQAGSFEASDMAKWFPQLLAGMEKNGITGLDAVTSLGSMLQVQMKTAGSSDEAANNFKNWMEKLGAGDVVKAYKDAGIDYQASLNTGLQKGMNVIEASMALAMKYVKATDPAKAEKIEQAKAKIDKEVDPEKARAALDALEKTLRTGDIFADMQVKAALTAYGQNRGLYEELKADSRKASGILDKNLAERRETSSQLWAETMQSVNDSMRSIGDAIRPMTDGVAKAITATAQGFTELSDNSKPVVAGMVAVGAGFIALKSVFSAFKIGKGLLNIGRGALLGRTGKPGEVQKVFVTNPGAGDADGDGDDQPKSKREIALGLLASGIKALGGKDAAEPENEGADAAEEGGKKPFSLMDTGLKVLDLLRPDEDGAANDGDGGSGEPQKVFVVNASAIGGAVGGSPAGPGQGGQGRRRGSRRRRSGRNGAGRPPSPPPTPPPPPPPRPVPGRMARLTGMVGKLGAVSKGIPGGALLEAGINAVDTYQNAETQDEKAEGYGGAAGGLAGTLAGAAAGAAIGSVVPILGTAIGGAVGAYLGSLGGEAGGSWLGKKLFGSDDEDKDESKQPPPAEASQQTGPAETKPTDAAAASPVVVKPSPVVVSPAAPGQPAAPIEARPAGAATVPPVVVRPSPVVLPPAAPGQPAVPIEAKPAGGATVPPVVVKPGPVVLPPVTPSQPGQVEVKALARPAEAMPKPAVSAAVPPAQLLPTVGEAVGQQAKPAGDQKVTYDPPAPGYGAAFMVPALPAQQVRFPGADLVPPKRPVERQDDSGPPLPPAVQAALKLPRATDRPASPLVLPAKAPPPAALGDLVRELAVPPAQTAAVLAKAPAPAKAAAPKVEQQFEFKPSLQITVQGDVKDPAQLARELEPHMRAQWEAFSREVAARQASTQLFDAPHI